MRKNFVSLCMAGALMGLTACGGAKQAASVASLNGEWCVIEVEGDVVQMSQVEHVFPFLGFDTTEGRVYGYTGCNRLLGSFDVKAKPGSLDLSALGGTKMMCPDMKQEQKLLQALAKVKGYLPLEDGLMGLVDEAKKPLLVLKHRVPGSMLEDLDGKWRIVMAGGEEVSADLEKVPFLEFDVKERRVHGCAGCNLINGEFVTSSSSSSSAAADASGDASDVIRFPQLASTMMACPDEAVEQRVLSALNSVARFGVVESGFGLYNEEGVLVLVLNRF